MRKIITTTFVTLDGVMQAPGGPKEDTSGGFAYGGWSFNYWDKLMGGVMNGIMQQPFELLLGGRTYDIFAAHWPKTKNDPLVAEKFNSTKKYVASRSPKELLWHNSTLLTGDVAAQIKDLKKLDAPDLWVHGSGNLIQLLLEHSLVDLMYIWTFPVIVGSGKRLFEKSSKAAAFKLLDSKTSATGVIVATYEPAGELKLGSFAD